jgi:hypothetical protein
MAGSCYRRLDMPGLRSLTSRLRLVESGELNLIHNLLDSMCIELSVGLRAHTHPGNAEEGCRGALASRLLLLTWRAYSSVRFLTGC